MPRAAPKSRFLEACRRRPVDRVPVWFMRQAGRYLKEYRALREKYSILQLVKNPELACEVTLQPLRKMPVDAAILFADILLPVEAMGLKLRFSPRPVIDNPVRGALEVRRLKEFEPRDALRYVMEAVRLVRSELAGKTPLIGFAGAPFTLASYMIEGEGSRDFIKTKLFMHSQPKAWDLLMHKVRKATEQYLLAQVEAGAQAVQLFDSWAGALSPDEYRRFVLPHSRHVLSALSGCGAPVIHFGTGTAGFLEDFASAGGDVIGVDSHIDLSEVWRRLPAKAVQGNLDPALLLAPRKVLKREVRKILREGGWRHGFVFNLGHGVLPQTPEENARAVVDWVHEWGVR